jgi:hypothetical protein
VVSQGSNGQPPLNNTEFIDFGNGVSLVRDGTIDGLKLLTTKRTTSKLVATTTGVDLGSASPPFFPFNWATFESIPANTLANNSFQIALPSNTVSVRLIAGDPATKGTHTVVELHRDPADPNGTYIGTISIQDAQ